MEDDKQDVQSVEKDNKDQIVFGQAKELEDSTQPVQSSSAANDILPPTPSPTPGTPLEEKPGADETIPPHVTETPTPFKAAPAKRRPPPPVKGILKPPPPPVKPTLTNRLRDMVVSGVTTTGIKNLWDDAEPLAGPSRSPQTVSQAVGGTLNAISGRLMGLGRLVNSAPTTPVRDTLTPMLFSEKSRQKRPLRRATFILPNLSIIYPINSNGEPWSQKVLDDRAKVSRLGLRLIADRI